MRVIVQLFFIHLFSIALVSAQITTEEILIKNDTIELPGTLSYSKKNSPLLIWIHGSGNVDRNGNQGTMVKANYIQQFRESINKNEIAFFSYDKRTSNKKNFKFLKETLFDDFANDAKKVVNYFKEDQRFSKIILVGHSQGSLVAMLASEKIDGYISLAGTPDPIDITISKQLSKQSAELAETATSYFKELKKTGGVKEVHPFLATIFSKQNLPFFLSWMQYNPKEELKKLNMPVLIVNGTKDIQVPIEDAKPLHISNKNIEAIFIENMNHVLKDIQKEEDNLSSYYSSEYPISKELIAVITAFVTN
jgi:pimeloyl-ACP methyl ester carboxylesterase